MKCNNCGSDRWKRGTTPEALPIDGRTFKADLAADLCETCGESLVSIDELGRFEGAIAAELARAGARSGEAIKFMRKTIGLRAVDLADLLGRGAGDGSRGGRRVSGRRRGRTSLRSERLRARPRGGEHSRRPIDSGRCGARSVPRSRRRSGSQAGWRAPPAARRRMSTPGLLTATQAAALRRRLRAAPRRDPIERGALAAHPEGAQRFRLGCSTLPATEVWENARGRRLLDPL